MLKRGLAVAGLMAMPCAVLAQDGGDADKGEQVFRKSMACHVVGADAKNKVGPVLNGVVGRAVAAVPDFQYSDVLVQLGADGTAWSPDELAAFLEKPRDHAKGTGMSFAGLRKEDERADVIAYLASFAEEGA